MHLVRDLADLPANFCRGAVSIGNFDGVHRGHALLVERLLHQAQKVNGPAVVFTFDPHPVRLLRPEQAPPPLTWTDRKAELLAALGVDAIIAYPTDEALLSLSAEEFFQKIVCRTLEAQAMVEGPNFYFGKNRTGNATLLRQLCEAQKIGLEIVEPLVEGDQIVSSSRVRSLLLAGSVEAAADLLTRPYRLRGMVRHGAARGARIGFPTANLDAIDTLLPGAGVYAAQALVRGKLWPAAVNIGGNPTFGEPAIKVEVHLIGFSGSIYGEPVEVDFSARLRDIQPFGSVDELKRQLARDVAAARDLFHSRPA